MQEYTQAQNKILPVYELVEEKGKDHQREFVVRVAYMGEEVGRGVGYSKKEAEQVAAYEACIKLGVINE